MNQREIFLKHFPTHDQVWEVHGPDLGEVAVSLMFYGVWDQLISAWLDEANPGWDKKP